MIRKLFTVSIFFILFLNSYSQRFTKFTEKPESYLKEMNELFERSNTNYTKGKELLEVFEESWLEGGFSKEKQQSIYEISNLLLKRRALNFPHFYNYITALIAFDTITTDSMNYVEWQKCLRFLIQDKKTKLNQINSFIEGSIFLLQKNAVYYSQTVSWLADNDKYRILLDGDTAKFIFDKLNLTGKLRKDSIIIHETSGTFYPTLGIWKGKSAKVYWEKAGLRKNISWAEFGAYSFHMNKAYYTIEHVDFYNKNYFDYPLKGTLTDKIVEVRSPESLSYPRFESDEAQFEIKEIFKDIDYKGGFKMQGSGFIGSGSKDSPASLSLYRDVELIVENDTIIEKQLFMKTLSFYYTFGKQDITSRNAKISMYVGIDSIYHPGLLFRYYDNTREINLIRDDDAENMSRSPYYDTYHKIEMDFELLKWRMDDLNVEMTMLRGTSINIANFESADYFSAARYYEVQGLEQLHPYLSLKKYAQFYNTKTFHVEDLAKFMGLPLVPVQRLLIQLTYTGIVDYNFETEYCTLKPKLYKYLDAIVGRKDYDLINFESRTNAPNKNALLNLHNMDLEIKGVPMINLSDSQNVVFYPKNQEILLKKNRDFDFAGKIEAGLFTYYGQNFQFKYDSFKIVLNEIDSLNIKVQAGTDNWGRRILANVQNVIEDVTGDIVIDDPNNKSGVKAFPEYPIFESKETSYVYYDAKNIQKGKYTRDKFFFIVDPYVIDSLNSFSTEGMGYDGELHSSDIFPLIRQRLVLQKDNSLGFNHDTPSEGLPLYKDKGQYVSNIHLSNQGLRGDGYMTYLTSKTTSDDFIFYPDSTNVYTTNFHINKQTTAAQYPEVRADKVYVHWMPYEDEMYSETVEQAFVMYETKAKHSGKLLYTPESLIGSGKTSYNNGSLMSKLYKFNADKFNTDSAAFELKSINTDKLAFKTDSINAQVDFIAMKSTFRSNTGTSKVELRENLYEAYIEKFSWLMEKKTMQLSTPNTIQVFEHGKTKIVERDDVGYSPKGSLFVSVHSGQDSLNWVSSETDFDLQTNTIFAHKVKFIQVADANIFPFEEEVTVEPVAKMRTLRKAEVLANTETKHHRFHDATINISSRHQYHGEGKYNYLDELGRFQVINFDVIAVDSIEQTFANGKVKGIENFSLSPAFSYQGKVSLKARDKYLMFDGYTKINHECDAISENWLKFESEINPLNIYIPLGEQPKDINEKFLVSGVMLATDSIHVFPTFISPRKTYSNQFVSTAGGFLTFKKKDKKYYIGEKYRIQNPDTIGDLLSLHKNFCNLYGEGNIDLTADLGQIKIKTKGNANYDLPKDRVKLDLVMTIDFFFPEKNIKFIGDTIKSMTGLPPISLKYRTYQMGMKELLGSKVADAMLKEQEIFGILKKIPDELLSTFVLSELSMKWNKEDRAWQSEGEFGIVNILGSQINRKVKGNLEIQRKRSGDSFTLYIEISETHWYFFTYKRGLMQAYSSEGLFNDMIAETKVSDRKMDIERGETSYVFFLSNKKKRDDFLKRMRGEKVDDEDAEDADYEQYEDFD
ncbi:MAG: hypothetical protein JEZ09_00355 [Salinivirgaceae bacterium]|nr:hypothetical protein [Salinivirgaceae bacterium]